MAKDTEKLIRQLSLISFLMAQGRPVSALEIKREVEGYSVMNEDAFARRFYADRAELDSLGIELQVDRPGDGFFEAELYTLPPENFYLPVIEFTDDELAALRTSLSLLTEGEFAYAEPLRLALQQVAWGHPNPLADPDRTPVSMAKFASTSSRDLTQRLARIETAISRHKTVTFEYHTIERDEVARRKVDPYHLVFRGGQFYLIGYAHEREAVRVFRLSRIRGKVGYATKSEHDFTPPEEFERRDYAELADWQLGEQTGTARLFFRERIAWLIERDFGRHGTVTQADPEETGEPGIVLETGYASERELIAWVLRWRQNAEVLGPERLRDVADDRIALLRDRHLKNFDLADPSEEAAPPARERRQRKKSRSPAAIRPERFGRLVTLAGMLIGAAKENRLLSVSDLCRRFELSAEELRNDIDVLNVVNFGGGTYVLYAEIKGGSIEIDSEPYGDSFARPARLLPLEAKALVAAIDLVGDHLPQTRLDSAREKIIEALGHDPAREGLAIAVESGGAAAARVVNEAIAAHRVLKLNYYKENEDTFSERTVEPYRLENGREGWYAECFDLDRKAMRHFKLDRIKTAEITGESFDPRPEAIELAGVEGWMSDGKVPEASVARVWVSPERSRWLREERNVVEELVDGSVVVELPYAGTPWLVREILRGAGDLVVLDPPEAREAISRELAA
ncbi:MAG: WYL domain-containing protein [Solirubrobacterales bacterium]|nr:WYL domain-containing protein [Solirubrobacterales bacterium]